MKTTNKVYSSSFDALGRSPLETEKLKLQAALLREIRNHFLNEGLNERELAALLDISMKQASDLYYAKFSSFTLDDLLMFMYRGKLYFDEIKFFNGLGY